jgi:hypothetical protein
MNKVEQFKLYQRRHFEPSNNDDMKVVRKFFHSNKWDDGCPFFLEWPYLDIPSMIKDRITQYTLKGLK